MAEPSAHDLMLHTDMKYELDDFGDSIGKALKDAYQMGREHMKEAIEVEISRMNRRPSSPDEGLSSLENDTYELAVEEVESLIHDMD